MRLRNFGRARFTNIFRHLSNIFLYCSYVLGFNITALHYVNIYQTFSVPLWAPGYKGKEFAKKTLHFVIYKGNIVDRNCSNYSINNDLQSVLLLTSLCITSFSFTFYILKVHPRHISSLHIVGRKCRVTWKPKAYIVPHPCCGQ